MFGKQGVFASALVFAVVVFSASGTAEAKKKNNNNKAKQNRQRQQRAANDQRIRANETRLKAIKREENAIRKQIEYVQKQIPLAHKGLSQALPLLQRAGSEVGSAQQALKKAKAAAKYASENLAVIAKQVEENQPTGSPFAKTLKSYLDAKAQYARAMEAVTNSSQYKEARSGATTSASKSRYLAQLRRELLKNDPDVNKARDPLRTSKAAYEKLRDEVLNKSSDWRNASETLGRAKKKESEAARQLDTLARKFAAMKGFFAKTQGQLKSMEVALSRGKAALKQISATTKSLQNKIKQDRRARNRSGNQKGRKTRNRR